MVTITRNSTIPLKATIAGVDQVLKGSFTVAESVTYGLSAEDVIAEALREKDQSKKQVLSRRNLLKLSRHEDS